MTERDAFEDVLIRFRPAGPRPDMQPPALLLHVPSSGGVPRVPRIWIAAGVLLLSLVVVGAAWIWNSRAPQPVVQSPVQPPIAGVQAPRTGPGQAGATVSGTRETPIIVGRDVPEPKRTRVVAPVYSVEPLPGVVAVLELLVDPQGRVDAVNVVRGEGPSALEAAEAGHGWQYEPLALAGEPVWFLITVVVWYPLR